MNFQQLLSRSVMIFFRLRVEGLEHLDALPDPTRVILAGNHQGFLDGFIVTAAYPHAVRFISKEEILAWPIVGPLFKKLGNPIVIFKHQPAKALRDAARHLQQHGTLCIFPEGRLSRDGTLEAFHPGATIIQKLASQKLANVPIVPFTLMGSHTAWHWGQWLPRLSTTITIRFGPALLPAEETPEAVMNRLKCWIQENLSPQTTPFPLRRRILKTRNICYPERCRVEDFRGHDDSRRHPKRHKIQTGHPKRFRRAGLRCPAQAPQHD